MREAAARALQIVVDTDLARLLVFIADWMDDPSLWVRRAAIAAIGEPRLHRLARCTTHRQTPGTRGPEPAPGPRLLLERHDCGRPSSRSRGLRADARGRRPGHLLDRQDEPDQGAAAQASHQLRVDPPVRFQSADDQVGIFKRSAQRSCDDGTSSLRRGAARSHARAAQAVCAVCRCVS